MKNALILATALIGGALLANLLLTDPGYVALRLGGRLIEMSAVTFALLLIALYFLVRLGVQIWNARRIWQQSQTERRRERARRSLAQGLLEMTAGDWETAETTLTRHVRDAEQPLAHYLAAARAAELQGMAGRRDEWLTRALETSSEARVPALVMQAELQLKHKQVSAALATLEQLEAGGESNARTLMLLARIYHQTGAWQQLQALEPRLRSMRGITEDMVDQTLAQVHLDRLKAAGASADKAQLQAVWKAVPKSMAQRADVAIAYARAAVACSDPDAAEAYLAECIARQWDEAAVLAYGEVEGSDPLKPLEKAESWLASRPQDAALLLSCARLAIRAELYGKARSYLETSIGIRPRPEAYQLLAGLMEQLGERERSLQALNDGLALAVGRRANLKVRARRWTAGGRSDPRLR
ncbi:heme biosynthesis HemY N-terminal domain-containing protein [Steroidobacter denitrificans]|nr:heme biosynthesis HemY N-terminal domain-containing protein [Steroidobacter denitrificans]